MNDDKTKELESCVESLKKELKMEKLFHERDIGSWECSTKYYKKRVKELLFIILGDKNLNCQTCERQMCDCRHDITTFDKMETLSAIKYCERMKKKNES